MLFVFLFQLLWPICGGSPLGIRSNDHRIIPSCQQVFEFRMRTDYYVYGMLTVPSPPLNRFSVPLLVKFMLNTRLPTVRTTKGETALCQSRADNVNFLLSAEIRRTARTTSLTGRNAERHPTASTRSIYHPFSGTIATSASDNGAVGQ